MLETTVIFLLFYSHFGGAYNIDTTSPVELKSNEKDGLFGHSVALSKDNVYAVYVGAPHDNKHGNVYKCRNSGSCSFASVNNLSDKKVFFGATVSINKNARSVVTCSHLEDAASSSNPTTDYSPWELQFGKCYQSNVASGEFSILLENPFDGRSAQPEDPEGNGWNTDDAKIPNVGMMGSVHIQTRSGNLVYNVPYANTGYSPEKDRRLIRMSGSIVRMEQNDKRVIAEGAWIDDYKLSNTAHLEDPHHMDQTGNAIVQGNFFDNDMNSEHFAIGAPKANKLTGRVYVCYKCFYPKAERNNGKTSFQLEVDSTQKQTGERFGAAVAAVDVDGDGIDELVVGAPLYSSKELGGIGRVFVYQMKRYGTGMKMLGELQSPCSIEECRFGFAISNLGDVDKDGKEDFAVGAPYEDDGSGAIYVYYGKNINDGDFGRCQKLGSSEARLKRLNLKGFGYSISKEVVDVDDNQFNDLAVGAPFSDKAVLLKSRPVIRFDDTEPIVAIDPDPVDPQSGQFEIRLDINLNKSDSLFLLNTKREPIKARIQVELKDDRVNVNPQDRERIIDITTSEKEETFTFTSSNNFGVTENDLEEPKPIKINFKVQFELDCQPSLDCPVFDQNMKLTQHLENPIRVELLSGCQIKDKCQCNLRFESTFTQTEIVVDKTKDLMLTYDIPNDGHEPGYGVKLALKSNIKLKTPSRLVGLKNCEVKGNDRTELECDLTKIKKSQTSKIELRLPLPGENFEDHETFEITPTLHSDCNGEKKETTLDKTSLKLEFKSDLKIKVPEGQELRYARDLPTNLVQTIDVTNLGPSFTNQATKVFIFVPKYDFIKSEDQIEESDCVLKSNFQVPKGFKLDEDIKNYFCESKETCQAYECTIAKHWQKDETKTINIEFNIGPFDSESLVPNSFILHTQVMIKDQDPVFTTIKLFSGALGAIERLKQNWPIVLGVSLGFLVVLGIFLGLWKTGLLAKMRPYKVDEEEAKEENRKTQIRMSVKFSNLPQTE